MTDERGALVSQTVKDFVDREIANLKEKVYIELNARATALALDQKASERKLELDQKAMETAHHDRQWKLGIFFVIVNIIIGLGIALAAHLWK